jgi:hypothetical protein
LSNSYSTLCNAIEIGLARRSPDLEVGEGPAESPDA